MNERMNRVRDRINQVFQEEYEDFIPAEEAVFILSSLISYIAMPEVFESRPVAVEITPAQQEMLDRMRSEPALDVIPNQDFMDGFMTAAAAVDETLPAKTKTSKRAKAKSIAIEEGTFERDDLF